MLNIDHALNSNSASGYRKTNALADRMLKRANGEEIEETRSHSPIETTPIDYSFVPVSEPVVRRQTDDNTVTIENKNIPFEIAYPFDNPLMSVGFTAMSVDVSDDSVSILMKDIVQLKLPKLVPLRLTVNHAPYKACWAGGSHNFGKFKHISFVILE